MFVCHRCLGKSLYLAEGHGIFTPCSPSFYGMFLRHFCASMGGVLVAPYGAIMRYYCCDTPYRAILFRGGGGWHPPKWCDTPLWYLFSHRYICAIPHFATSRAIIARHLIKTSTKEICNTIAASISGYAEYRCWASKWGVGAVEIV